MKKQLSLQVFLWFLFFGYCFDFFFGIWKHKNYKSLDYRMQMNNNKKQEQEEKTRRKKNRCGMEIESCSIEGEKDGIDTWLFFMIIYRY
jgi:hypothetical protein